MTDQNIHILKETDSKLCETEVDERLNIEEGSKKEFIDNLYSIKQNGNVIS